MNVRKKLLSGVLIADALLLIAFGAASYFLPTSTYATIIDLSGLSEGALMFAVLGSLSVFYVVLGALCMLAAFMPSPHDVRVAFVMIAQHVWVGARGFHDAGRAWIVGDPWPDIIIHAAFVVAYGVAIALRLRR